MASVESRKSNGVLARCVPSVWRAPVVRTRYALRSMLSLVATLLVLWVPSPHSTAQIGNIDIQSLGLGGLAEAVGYDTGRGGLADSEGLDPHDLQDLEAGQLSAVRNKYAAMPRGSLTMSENRVLCDLQISFGRFSLAVTCLESLLDRAELENLDEDSAFATALIGRLALLDLAAGRFDGAAARSAALESDGGRYLFALASAKSGNTEAAEAVAESFSRGAFIPRHAFFAANIWLALDRCDESLELLLSPRVRLASDYGLKSSTGLFGREIQPASLRLHLFDDVTFGLFDGFSYGPRANQYVEFITGYCLANSGQVGEGRERLKLVLHDTGAQATRQVLWMTHYELARLAADGDDLHSAKQHLKQAVRVIEHRRRSALGDAGRIGLMLDQSDVYEDLLALQIKTGEYQLALETMERAKGRALLGWVSETDELQPASGESPDALVGAAPYSYQQFAQQQMRDDELFLLYHQFGRAMYVMALRAGRVSVGQMDASALEQEVAQFRQELAQVDGQQFLPTAAALYDQLLRPFDKELVNVKRVTIVPSTTLSALPFAALFDGDKFFVERAPIRVLPSLGALQLIELATADTLTQPLLSDFSLDSVPGADGQRAVGTVFGLRLDAELVVLQPGEAALNLSASGADMTGLMAGFFYAGAKGVVTSLWPIPDQSSQVLLADVYRQLDNGLTPSRALRQAQLQAIANKRAPFFWTSFIYYGEDRPSREATAAVQ